MNGSEGVGPQVSVQTLGPLGLWLYIFAAGVLSYTALSWLMPILAGVGMLLAVAVVAVSGRFATMRRREWVLLSLMLSFAVFVVVDVAVRDYSSIRMGFAVFYQVSVVAAVLAVWKNAGSSWVMGIPLTASAVAIGFFHPTRLDGDIREHLFYLGALNQAALWVSLGFLVASWLLVYGHNLGGRGGAGARWLGKQRWFWLGLACMLFLVLLYVGSRQAILAGVVSVSALIMVSGHLKWFLVFGAVGALTVGFIGREWYLVERFQNLIDFTRSGVAGSEGSIPARMEMLSYGSSAWLSSPWVGHGARSFEVVSGFGKYSHNNYVEILVNFGVVGFVLFYTPLLIVIASALSRLRVAPVRPWAALVLAGSAFWLVQDLFIVSYFRFSHWVLVLVIVYACSRMVRLSAVSRSVG